MRETRTGARFGVAARTGALAAWITLSLGSSSAFAQTATALDRFEPAPAGDAFFAVPSAEAPGELRPIGAVVLSYAHAPLVLKRETAGDRETLAPIVDHQLMLHAMAAIELARRLKLELDVPFTLSQGGDSPSGAASTFSSPSGATLNDLRVGARLTLLPQDGLFPAAAIGASVWFPTGDETAYAGTGSTRFEPSITIGSDTADAVWGATIGRRFQGSGGSGLLGSEVLFGAGLAPRFGPLQVGVEVFGTTVADAGVTAFSRGSTSLEALLGARYKLGIFTFGGAAGPGFTAGAGTPDYRLIASVSIAPEPPPPEEKEDANAGNAGANDKVAAPAIVEHGPKDRDGDTVPDETDLCPDVVGVTDPGKGKLGCPPDRDGDGVTDQDDHCPDEPGPASVDPEKNGCPLDTDGDGIRDVEDACPNEKGPRNEEPKRNGCPTAVRVEGTQIVILQQVNFETARDVIRPDSFDLLQQVADVLRDHPEIARVAVDGHTDSRGTAASNVELSQRRALSVVRWLTQRGVDARRLEARGFGPRRPIADNKTDEGRAKNRRVEFQIRRRTPDGEAGWRDGPIEE